MKTGLVMEGGAMRGMFTAGVTDVMMENNISFDGAIGTSAGAVFGCNYKSHQIGRVIRYNKKYCKDKRFASLYSLITTGDVYGEDFAYNQIPNKLDIFDTETFKNSPMEFYVVCTDVMSGKAVYYKCDNADAHDIKWMQASASMPLASRLIRIDDYLLSDGGMTDSIPIRHFESLGYDRNVVILTQPADYQKEKNNLMPILKLVYRKYPKFITALAERHNIYNETLRYIKEREKDGKILVIRPPEALNVGSVEHDPDELERVYQIGRSVGIDNIDKIKKFLNVK